MAIKGNAASRQLIDVRRFDVWIAVATQCVIGLIVGEEKDDVRLCVGTCREAEYQESK